MKTSVHPFSLLRPYAAAAAMSALSACGLFGGGPQDKGTQNPDAAEAESEVNVEEAALAGAPVSADGETAVITWPAAVLAEEFETLVFGGQERGQSRPARLRRWTAPARIGLFFGRSAPADIRTADSSTVQSLAARLEHFTGHPVSLAARRPNIRVFVMNAEEIVSAGTAGRRVSGGTGSPVCILSAKPDPMPEGGLAEVNVYIRSDIPEERRHRCLHRQITRSLGFIGRGGIGIPSILSEQHETAEFTSFDDLMLRMLYDPRLRPGMTRLEARPAVEVLADELGAKRSADH